MISELRSYSCHYFLEQNSSKCKPIKIPSNQHQIDIIRDLKEKAQSSVKYPGKSNIKIPCYHLDEDIKVLVARQVAEQRKEVQYKSP